jgi:hypothetical protein
MIYQSRMTSNKMRKNGENRIKPLEFGLDEPECCTKRLMSVVNTQVSVQLVNP